MKKIFSKLLALSILTFVSSGFVFAQVYVAPVCSTYRDQNGYIQNTCGNTNTTTPNYYNNSTSYASSQYPELCSVLTRTLRTGAQGNDVKRLQVTLGQEGIAYLGATGYYGPATAAAVKIFQLRNGIYQTGTVGPQTLARMQSLWCQGGISTPYPTPTPINPVYPNTGSFTDVSIYPTVSSGNSVTLSWTGTNVNTCNLNGQSVPPIGQNVVTIYSQTDYTITCQNYSGQTVSKTITLRPNQDISSLPTVRLSINPTAALINTYATIYWQTTNASSCTLNGQNVLVNGSQQIYVSSSNQNYTVTCFSPNGYSVSSTINSYNSGSNNLLSSASIYANTNNINSGSPVTITWNSTNVNSCSVVGGTLSSSGLNGSQVIYPNQTTTYTITCFPSTGPSVTNNVTVYVNGSTNSSVSVTASANIYNITYSGQPITINYFSSNASYCNIINQTTGANVATNQATSGNYLVTPTGNTNYQVICYNSSGQNGVSNVQIYLNGSNTGTVSANLYANITNVNSGQAVTLSWTSTNASYCSLSGGTLSLSNQSANGSTVVYPTSNTYYYLTCYNGSGQSAATNVLISTNTNSSNISVTGSVSNSSVESGQGVTLSWNSTNANYCNIAFNGSNILTNQNPTASSAVLYPNTTGNYVVTCYNNSGQTGTSPNISVAVYAAGSTTSTTTTLFIHPASTTIATGQNSVLTIEVTNANYCTINGGTYNNTYFSGNTLAGQRTVTPTANTTYTATCYGTNNSTVNASSIVNIGSYSTATSSLVVTSNTNKTLNLSVTTPTSNNGTGTIIDWGDGTISNVTIASGVGTVSHLYSAVGTYNIKYLQTYGGNILGGMSVVIK